MRKPITEISDLHDLVDLLTDLAWALSAHDREIQFTLMDGTNHVGRVTLVDSGPLASGDPPPYFAEMTVQLSDGSIETFNLLDVSCFGPQRLE